MSLRSRLLLAFSYVLLLAVVAVEVPVALGLRHRVGAEIRTQASGEAAVLAAAAGSLLDGGRDAGLARLAATVARSVRGRVVVVDLHGRVLADSAGAARRGVRFGSRPEFVEALAGRSYQGARPSRTLGRPILATALPVLRDGRIAGAVRVTQSVYAADRAVGRATLGLAAVGGVVLLLGLAVGALLARQIARPVRALEHAARRLAAGELDARAGVEGSAEQRSLAHSFNDMADRLASALVAERRFVADASHQLRTPLTALRLRIEEALAVGVPDAAARELDHGTREIDRLARTADELLELGRAGGPAGACEQVDLGTAAEAAVERWRGYARERGIRLLAAGGGAVALCARSDVDRALDMLVENALAYSPRGTAVTVAAGAGVIAVEDEGPGLDEDEVEAVFARFRRGRSGLAGPVGTGLGLPIARELARRWGGEALLASRPTGGSRALLAFPPAPGTTA